jgi:hypothetical protein
VVGIACFARSASEKDQRVRDVNPGAFRKQLHELPLDLHRILLVGERQPLADPPDVRVDEDPVVGLRPRITVGEDDVRGLSRDTAQGREFRDRARHVTAEAIDDVARRGNDRPGLLTEKSRRFDDRFDIGGPGRRERFGCRVALEEPRSHLIDDLVGALRRQDRRDQELPRIVVREGRPGLRIGAS